MDDFGKRLQILIKSKKLTKAKVARIGEIGEKLIFNYINGATNPKLQFLENMLNHFDDLDARWFITGKYKNPQVVYTIPESMGAHQVAENEDEYYAARIKQLEKENDLLRKTIEDKDEINKLLKKQLNLAEQ